MTVSPPGKHLNPLLQLAVNASRQRQELKADNKTNEVASSTFAQADSVAKAVTWGSFELLSNLFGRICDLAMTDILTKCLTVLFQGQSQKNQYNANIMNLGLGGTNFALGWVPGVSAGVEIGRTANTVMTNLSSVELAASNAIANNSLFAISLFLKHFFNSIETVARSKRQAHFNDFFDPIGAIKKQERKYRPPNQKPLSLIQHLPDLPKKYFKERNISPKEALSFTKKSINEQKTLIYTALAQQEITVDETTYRVHWTEEEMKKCDVMISKMIQGTELSDDESILLKFILNISDSVDIGIKKTLQQELVSFNGSTLLEQKNKLKILGKHVNDLSQSDHLLIKKCLDPRDSLTKLEQLQIERLFITKINRLDPTLLEKTDDITIAQIQQLPIQVRFIIYELLKNAKIDLKGEFKEELDKLEGKYSEIELINSRSGIKEFKKIINKYGTHSLKEMIRSYLRDFDRYYLMPLTTISQELQEVNDKLKKNPENEQLIIAQKLMEQVFQTRVAISQKEAQQILTKRKIVPLDPGTLDQEIFTAKGQIGQDIISEGAAYQIGNILGDVILYGTKGIVTYNPLPKIIEKTILNDKILGTALWGATKLLQGVFTHSPELVIGYFTHSNVWILQSLGNAFTAIEAVGTTAGNSLQSYMYNATNACVTAVDVVTNHLATLFGKMHLQEAGTLSDEFEKRCGNILSIEEKQQCFKEIKKINEAIKEAGTSTTDTSMFQNLIQGISNWWPSEKSPEQFQAAYDEINDAQKILDLRSDTATNLAHLTFLEDLFITHAPKTLKNGLEASIAPLRHATTVMQATLHLQQVMQTAKAAQDIPAEVTEDTLSKITQGLTWAAGDNVNRKLLANLPAIGLRAFLTGRTTGFFFLPLAMNLLVFPRVEKVNAYIAKNAASSFAIMAQAVDQSVIGTAAIVGGAVQNLWHAYEVHLNQQSGYIDPKRVVNFLNLKKDPDTFNPQQHIFELLMESPHLREEIEQKIHLLQDSDISEMPQDEITKNQFIQKICRTENSDELQTLFTQQFYPNPFPQNFYRTIFNICENSTKWKLATDWKNFETKKPEDRQTYATLALQEYDKIPEESKNNLTVEAFSFLPEELQEKIKAHVDKYSATSLSERSRWNIKDIVFEMNEIKITLPKLSVAEFRKLDPVSQKEVLFSLYHSKAYRDQKSATEIFEEYSACFRGQAQTLNISDDRLKQILSFYPQISLDDTQSITPQQLRDKGRIKIAHAYDIIKKYAPKLISGELIIPQGETQADMRLLYQQSEIIASAFRSLATAQQEELLNFTFQELESYSTEQLLHVSHNLIEKLDDTVSGKTVANIVLTGGEKQTVTTYKERLQKAQQGINPTQFDAQKREGLIKAIHECFNDPRSNFITKKTREALRFDLGIMHVDQEHMGTLVQDCKNYENKLKELYEKKKEVLGKMQEQATYTNIDAMLSELASEKPKHKDDALQDVAYKDALLTIEQEIQELRTKYLNLKTTIELFYNTTIENQDTNFQAAVEEDLRDAQIRLLAPMFITANRLYKLEFNEACSKCRTLESLQNDSFIREQRTKLRSTLTKLNEEEKSLKEKLSKDHIEKILAGPQSGIEENIDEIYKIRSSTLPAIQAQIMVTEKTLEGITAIYEERLKELQQLAPIQAQTTSQTIERPKTPPTPKANVSQQKSIPSQWLQTLGRFIASIGNAKFWFWNWSGFKKKK